MTPSHLFPTSSIPYFCIILLSHRDQHQHPVPICHWYLRRLGRDQGFRDSMIFCLNVGDSAHMLIQCNRRCTYQRAFCISADNHPGIKVISFLLGEFILVLDLAFLVPFNGLLLVVLQHPDISTFSRSNWSQFHV